MVRWSTETLIYTYIPIYRIYCEKRNNVDRKVKKYRITNKIYIKFMFLNIKSIDRKIERYFYTLFFFTIKSMFNTNIKTRQSGTIKYIKQKLCLVCCCCYWCLYKT